MLESEEGRGLASWQIKIDVKRRTKHKILQLAIGNDFKISKQAKVVLRFYAVIVGVCIEAHRLSFC